MCYHCIHSSGRWTTYNDILYANPLAELGAGDAELRRRKSKLIYREEKMPEIEAVRTGGTEKELLTFRVKRSIDGLKIVAKSEVLANFFASYRDPIEGEVPGITRVPKWGGLSIVKMSKFPVLQDATFDRPGEQPIVGDYVVNLTWLRSPDLGKGIEFVIKGPFSTSQAKNFYVRAKDALKELFNEYLEDTDMEYTLTGRSSI